MEMEIGNRNENKNPPITVAVFPSWTQLMSGHLAIIMAIGLAL